MSDVIARAVARNRFVALRLVWSIGSSTGAVLMSHADQLIEIATELAMDAKDNVAELQRKLSAVETAKLEIEARLNTANHALERLSSFVSIRGSDLQCPRYWINNEVIIIFGARPARAISICKFKYRVRNGQCSD